jgi:Xaa-Pro aminopeptidase
VYEIDKRSFCKVISVMTMSAGTPTRTSARAIPATASPPPALIDRDRARFIMAATGLDALLLGRPESSYHATSAVQALNRLGIGDSSFALVPRDAAAPITHIAPQFAHYYMAADAGFAPGVEQRLVTAPGAAGEALAATTFLLRDPADLMPREARRRQATDLAAPFYPTMAAALASALAGLGPAPAIGHDTEAGAILLASAAPSAQPRPAADIARHVRLVRTPAEIALMRAASAANVAAALATAAEMRSLGSIAAVRAAFNSRVAALGNTPVFMVIDGVVDDRIDADLVDGQAALIDCVSHRAGYHGDFGRTVFIGTPSPTALARARTTAAAWDAVRGQLRPGLRFSQIRALGAATLAQMGSDLRLPFNPHCVGLAHTDQPWFDLSGQPFDPVLEAGMTISVDCPLMEASAGGSFHLEDLTLITRDGSTPLHDIGAPFIIA